MEDDIKLILEIINVKKDTLTDQQLVDFEEALWDVYNRGYDSGMWSATY
jgi:hypothetical protein